MTRRASSSVTPGVSQPKFMVAWSCGTLRQVVPMTDHEPGLANEMGMSVFGGSSHAKRKFARCMVHSGANFRTSAFCSSVPSMKDIEIVSPDCHFDPLTRAALACELVGAGALNQAKHHLSRFSASWVIAYPLLEFV
jgi:hypothetical protein